MLYREKPVGRDCSLQLAPAFRSLFLSMRALKAWVQEIASGGLLHQLVGVGMLVGLAVLLGRTALWVLYRPIVYDARMPPLPSLTVVIPAYNEGAHVRRSIESVLDSNYPKNNSGLLSSTMGRLMTPHSI